MKIKINNLEFREYTFSKKDKQLYEICKWVERINDTPYCFVIAFIEKGSESWELKSVGERLLELTPEEWEDFHKVYTIGQSKLNKL
jgi:uncharacterized protein YozE (UPF0346 family)